MAREREWSLGDEAERERPDGGADETQDRGDPERPLRVAPGVGDASPAEHNAALRNLFRSRQMINPTAVGDRQPGTGPSW